MNIISNVAVLATICVKLISEQPYFLLLLFPFYFYFITKIWLLPKNAKIVNIHCYSYQVKKLFYRMNGVRVLTAHSAASVVRRRRSFLSDVSLSKHSSEHFSLLYL